MTLKLMSASWKLTLGATAGKGTLAIISTFNFKGTSSKKVRYFMGCDLASNGCDGQKAQLTLGLAACAKANRSNFIWLAVHECSQLQDLKIHST